MASKKSKHITIIDLIPGNGTDSEEEEHFQIMKELKTPKSFYQNNPENAKFSKRLHSESTACKSFLNLKKEIKVFTRPNEYYEGEVDEYYVINGWGKYFYSCGDSYEGNFKDGMRHGYGEYVYKNGGRYVGEWSQDKKNGKGAFKFGSTDVEGYWKDDEFVKGCKSEIHQLDKNSFYQTESFLADEENEKSKYLLDESIDESKKEEILKKFKIHIDLAHITTDENGQLILGDTFTFKNKPGIGL